MNNTCHLHNNSNEYPPGISFLRPKYNPWQFQNSWNGRINKSFGGYSRCPRDFNYGNPQRQHEFFNNSGGLGMYLLQKMGWRPGEGLGRGNHGPLEPLPYRVKLDKMGVMAKTERRQYQKFKQKKTATCKSPPKKQLKPAKAKHPVSLLSEYAMQEKMKPPEYSIHFESGPCHKKNFVYKVTFNGVEYKPDTISANKKDAKALAAEVCAKALGILPS